MEMNSIGNKRDRLLNECDGSDELLGVNLHQQMMEHDGLIGILTAKAERFS